MKILVLGASGAAHALVWKLFNSGRIESIAAMPGNGGTGLLAPNVPARESIKATVEWANQENFRIIIPADGSFLNAGLVEEAAQWKIAVWGAPKRSVLLEQSVLWAKEFLNRYKIPTATGRAFGDLVTAERYLASQTLPVMLSGDEPSEFDGGYSDRAEAMTALEGIFSLPLPEGRFRGVVIETPALGPTVAYSCLTDGQTLLPLQAVRTYDRLENGDAGWAAVGMGAHSGASPLLDKIGEFIHVQIMQPLLAALQREKLAWWGVLGVDCAITAEGPKVLRIRSTLSDSEAHVLLPRLTDDLLGLIAACNNRSLHTLPSLRWQQQSAVGVTIVASGYPHSFPTGIGVRGMGDLDAGMLAFHNETINPNSMEYVSSEFQMPEKRRFMSGLGTAFSEAMLVRPTGPNILTSQGGRILTLVGQANSREQAREQAYANVAKLTIPSSYYRTDIGASEL